MSVLAQPVESLPGIGPVSGKALRERGFDTVGDLVWLLPRRYDDQRTITPIGALQPGDTALTEGVVRSTNGGRPMRGRGRRGRMVEVRLEPRPEDSPGRYGVLRLVWFHGMPGLDKRFPIGRTVRVAGRIDEHRGVLSISHPEILKDAPTTIVPRYPSISGVAAKALSKAATAAVLRGAPFLEGAVPEPVAEAEQLTSLRDALARLHTPPDTLDEAQVAELNAGLSAAHRRLAYEEFFSLELTLQRRRAEEAGVAAHPAPRHAAKEAEHDAAFPFALTPDQRVASDLIREDLARAEPMRRLLQGDVGSGKTAVALLGAAQVVQAGHQVALVAPTEVLAEQHFRTVEAYAEGLGMVPVLVAGRLPAAERRDRLARVASGEANLIVGTHALMGRDVAFQSLALAIVDEQHRFGVAQRLALTSKGEGGTLPHLLVMTATPIPRTLALVLYADLEACVLRTPPPGRQPITTRRYPGRGRSEAYRQVERALAAGGKAFVVCPAVDETEVDSDDEGQSN